MNFADLKDAVPSGLTIVTATDGNHGYGVAYMANIIGCSSKVIYVKHNIKVLLKKYIVWTKSILHDKKRSSRLYLKKITGRTQQVRLKSIQAL